MIPSVVASSIPATVTTATPSTLPLANDNETHAATCPIVTPTSAPLPLVPAGLDPAVSSTTTTPVVSGSPPAPTVTMATVATATPRAGAATGASGRVGGSSSQNENTGRWTAEEHRLFLQGLEQFGKGWKKIAGLIQSRTVVQIRTHAQKYFQKLAKARQNGEEGDVTMEGRNAFAHSKKRRQSSSSKRKGVTSIVQSVMKEYVSNNTNATATVTEVAGGGPELKKPRPSPLLPCVGSVLSPYLGPVPDSGGHSVSLLEDTMHRFLTPLNLTADGIHPSLRAGDVGGSTPSAPANITLPSLAGLAGGARPNASPNSGESSPTGVNEFAFHACAAPLWFTKGADVDELLDGADGLDWLCDTGGDDSYGYDVKALSSTATPDCPTSDSTSVPKISLQMRSTSNKRASDDISISISDFDLISDTASPTLPEKRRALSATEALQETTTAVGSDDFADFDSNFDEQAFVSALLEGNSEN